MPQDFPFPGAHRHPTKQFEVLVYLALGCTRKEIAVRLDITPDSVKSRLLCALKHLEVSPQEAHDIFKQVREDVKMRVYNQGV